MQEPLETDVLVIGAGIAGLSAAVKIASNTRVLVLAKASSSESNTHYAQGGVAAALGENDSPELHFEDTMRAGAGLCDADAVNVLVHEGPERVRDLIDWGLKFDTKNGELAFGREGAHRLHRILHAHGDATGEMIQRTLVERARNLSNITLWNYHFTLSLIIHEGRCAGAYVLDEQTGEITPVLARATILATGGVGQLYRSTTNPAVATGDGVALAYRAGAQISGMEFLQFHPTALSLDGAPSFLISEAVRGEGAILRNAQGERFMPAYHEMAELAPRDVVSRAIVSELRKSGAKKVFLDVTHLDAQYIMKRFPTISKTCQMYGLDITRDWLPVFPSAHYSMGGVITDTHGRTSIPELYACGEVACTGIHGANRLASNSLLEGLVFGHRSACAILDTMPPAPHAQVAPLVCDTRPRDVEPAITRLHDLMWEKVGIVRDAEHLREAVSQLEEMDSDNDKPHIQPAVAQLQNMITTSRLLAAGALLRQESRGGHCRSDFPARDDKQWRRHIVFSTKGHTIRERLVASEA